MEKGQKPALSGFIFHHDTGKNLAYANSLVCIKLQG